MVSFGGSGVSLPAPITANAPVAGRGGIWCPAHLEASQWECSSQGGVAGGKFLVDETREGDGVG